MEVPALFRISEKSLSVALFGSTPREREKSFVARSILEILQCMVVKWWRMMDMEKSTRVGLLFT